MKILRAKEARELGGVVRALRKHLLQRLSTLKIKNLEITDKPGEPACLMILSNSITTRKTMRKLLEVALLY